MGEKKKIRFLSYKTPRFKWKYIINWLISIRTLSKYSHCEAWTTDEDGRFMDYASWWSHMAAREMKSDIKSPTGKCWTSTMRGKDNGTVCRDASGVLKHPENWVYFELEVGQINYDYMLEWMEEHVRDNKGYANWDVLKFISPIHFPDNKRNICSEFVNNALWWLQIGFKFDIVSPGYIYKMLIKMGYEAKDLK